MNHVLKDMVRLKKKVRETEGSMHGKGELGKMVVEAARFKKAAF
jgi:hypothetical protein